MTCSILDSLSIEYLSLSVSQPPFFIYEKSSWRSPRTMGDLIGGHTILNHMYGRMREHDPSRTKVVWLWIVDCELFGNCNADLLQRPSGLQCPSQDCASEKWMGYSGENVLFAMRGASETKSHWPILLSLCFFSLWQIPFHALALHIRHLHVLFPYIQCALYLVTVQNILLYSHILN